MITFLLSDPTSSKPGVTVTPNSVSHATGCPMGQKGWPDTSMTDLHHVCAGHGCRRNFIHASHKGLVYSTSEQNGYHDSDFYASVWNPETEAMSSICYASTRGWSYFNNAVPDMSAELRAEVDAILDARREAYDAKRKIERDAALAKLPLKGAMVRVKSNRSKLDKGTEGEVIWFGMSSYAKGRGWQTWGETKEEQTLRRLSDHRVGIKLANGDKVFASASVFEVIEPASERARDDFRCSAGR